MENQGRQNNPPQQQHENFFENLNRMDFINNIDNNMDEEIKRRQLKRQRRLEKKAKKVESLHNRDRSRLVTINPLTDSQEKVFDAYSSGKHLFLHGYAGTGKTFVSLYLALRSILVDINNHYQRIIVVRSVVPTRDIGYLPGSISEKIQAYEEPYEEICNDLFARECEKTDGYRQLKDRGLVEFTTTSFLRGLTFSNAIIIVDEVQNMSFSEMATIMTRLGDNCRVIFCGDFRQTDLKNSSEKRGLHHFINIVKNIDSIEHVEFTENDIVRSGICKQFIIQWENYKSKHDIV
jgi:phosphate starvation-inducible protein PhoH